MQKLIKQKIDKLKSYNQKLMLIRPLLLKFCRSRIFDHQEAEDVCQKTIYILLDKKKTYVESKSFYAWAFKIARFQIMSYMTTKKRNQEDVSEDSILHSIHAVESYMPFSDILKKELKDEQARQFELLKARLAPKEKSFFILSFEGKSKEYIKSFLNISDNGFSRLKGRVIKKMKDNLDTQKIETYKIKE